MREDRDPQEVSSLKGKEHVTHTNNVQSTVTLTQVNDANVQQPRDYVVLLSGRVTMFQRSLMNIVEEKYN
jgi:hypothetical protein